MRSTGEWGMPNRLKIRLFRGQTWMKWTEIFMGQSQPPGPPFPLGFTPRVLQLHVLPCRTLLSGPKVARFCEGVKKVWPVQVGGYSTIKQNASTTVSKSWVFVVYCSQDWRKQGLERTHSWSSSAVARGSQSRSLQSRWPSSKVSRAWGRDCAEFCGKCPCLWHCCAVQSRSIRDYLCQGELDSVTWRPSIRSSPMRGLDVTHWATSLLMRTVLTLPAREMLAHC